MKLHEVVRLINDIAARYEVAALTIAEPMPRLTIKIRNMLSQLPLLQPDAPAEGNPLHEKLAEAERKAH